MLARSSHARTRAPHCTFQEAKSDTPAPAGSPAFRCAGRPRRRWLCGGYFPDYLEEARLPLRRRLSVDDAEDVVRRRRDLLGRRQAAPFLSSSTCSSATRARRLVRGSQKAGLQTATALFVTGAGISSLCVLHWGGGSRLRATHTTQVLCSNTQHQ